jgi:capsular exopolysaccharide synthesis family protein
MSSYQVTLADLRRQRAELSATLTPAHYRIKRLDAQIQEVEAATERERSNIIKRIRIDYDAAVKRESQLQKDFDAQYRLLDSKAQKLIYYNILKREVETNNQLYQSTLQKGKEASVASAMRVNNAHVVDQARVPYSPVKPDLRMNLALGSLGGLFIGTAFVILRSRSDTSIHTPGTLSTRAELRELGVIPSAKTDPAVQSLTSRSASLLRGTVVRKGVAGRTLFGSDSESRTTMEALELVTWTRKRSMVAEAVRAAMTSILLSNQQGRTSVQVLLITSPSPQEGKSTIISNLGIALAEIGQRVLLIDGDMRLPRLHSIFDVPNTFGLSDVLNELKPLDSYGEDALVRKSHIPGLHILPAGPARASLSRLLYSPRMKDLTDRLRQTYDQVLIDTAPVLIVPDARILALAADAVVLVLRAHKTSTASALAANALFEEDGTPVLGTILNDWNPAVAGYGSYGSYGTYTRYYNDESRREE